MNYIHPTLYYKPTCPFCIKVNQFIQNNNIIGLNYKNTEVIQYRNELYYIGGKMQVPCLIIDNNAIYESDEIIKILSHARS